MKIASLILSSVSTLMVLSTVLCGAWLHSHGVTPEGVTFHARLATGTAVLTLICLVLLFILALQMQ